MKDIALYLLKSLFFRASMFFRRWFVGGFLTVYGVFRSWTFRIQKRFALRLNAVFLFQPLYQEYNAFGYIFGFLVRAWKICAGSFLYVCAAILCGVAYLIWILIPLAVVSKIIIG